MNIYERYGRKIEALEESQDSLLQTIDLLRKLKADEIKLDDIEVWDKGWALKKKDA